MNEYANHAAPESATPEPILPIRDRALLTFKEACAFLGIKRTALQRAIAEGQLICVQAPGTTSGHGKRILRKSIDAYLEDQIPSNASLKSSA